ncbi:MAG TPA: EAL domain-containing protein, partial [Acidobacteriota bacterium]|nr:EAL domain-containing protein [Acidobacteriota bacterium]
MIGNERFFQLLFPEDSYRRTIEEKAAFVMHGNAIDDFETLITTKEGGRRIISWLGRTLTDAAGTPVGAVGLGIDITDRKQREDEAKESLALLQATLEAAADGIFAADLYGNITAYNQRVRDMWGIPDSLMAIGSTRQIAEYIAPLIKNSDLFMKRVEEFHQQPDREYRDTLELKDGRAIDRYSRPLWIGNKRIGRVVTFHDISDIRRTDEILRQQQEALRETAERYALAALGANDGLWDWDLKTDQIYFSPRWKAMLGYTDEIGSNPEDWFSRIHPDDRLRFEGALESHLKGMTPHFEMEHRVRHRDGSYCWMLTRGIAVPNEKGEPLRMAGSQTDITQRKTTEQRLQHEAIHDVLTDLPNRALFMDLLARSLARAKRRSDYLFAVLFLDLDRFKLINDSLGHMIGDQLLIAMARRLERCLRPGDVVARLGGDEFTILLEDIHDGNDATRIADRIQTELKQPFQLGGQEVFTTASIGIALSAAGYDFPEDLLRDSDTAMYRAKAIGRACHQVFDSAMHSSAVALLRQETDLRRALERNEFVLYYQPTVCLRSGRIHGVEALIRWQHPDRGLVMPDDFIHQAEENGLIIPIGKWVLEEACRQMRIWQREYPHLTVSVNLSVKQFTQSQQLSLQVQKTLSEARFNPNYLMLEITESMLMENPEATAITLEQLKKLNVRIHIDDFGTGYSSLSYLHRFKIDTLKIDRSFVSRMSAVNENLEIVRTIVTLAHNLGMDVIAEGVETSEQLAQLRALKCERAQGFYFSEPVTAQEVYPLFGGRPRWMTGANQPHSNT